MEDIISDKSFLSAVKAWATFSYDYKGTRLYGKPEEVNDAIQNIQNFLGSQEVHTALGFNECYAVKNDNDYNLIQIQQWFRMPPETMFQDTEPFGSDDFLDLGELKVTGLSKTDMRNQISTQKQQGILVLRSDATELGDLHGHWVYAQQSKNVPNWFKASKLFHSSKSHSSHAWHNLHPYSDDIILFGDSYDYIQPWNSNSFCQATAIGFAIALTSDDKDMQSLVGSYTSVDQNKFDNLIQKQAWFKKLKNKRLKVPAWELTTEEKEDKTDEEIKDNETVDVNILGSELASKNDFASNWEISFQIVKHIYNILADNKLMPKRVLKHMKYDISIIDDFLLSTKDAAVILGFDR